MWVVCCVRSGEEEEQVEEMSTLKRVGVGSTRAGSRVRRLARERDGPCSRSCLVAPIVDMAGARCPQSSLGMSLYPRNQSSLACAEYHLTARASDCLLLRRKFGGCIRSFTCPLPPANSTPPRVPESHPSTTTSSLSSTGPSNDDIGHFGVTQSS